MEAEMNGHWVVAPASLVAVHLLLFVSIAPAQTVTGNGKMATGDVWSSCEEPIYTPREALELPNATLLRDLDVATGDMWPSRKGQSRIPEPGLTPTAQKH
jgi:hypothetical protein